MEGEYPRVSRTSGPVARKVHKCCECGRFVLPGERYEKVVGNWGGKWETYKTCTQCAALRQDVILETGDIPPFGYLDEHAEEAGIL